MSKKMTIKSTELGNTEKLQAQTIVKDELNIEKLQVHTITIENIFLKKPQFKWFHTEIECTDYIKLQPNLCHFGEDKNTKGAKRFLAIDYESIYLLSIMKKFHLYEYFSKTDKVKLILDIDIKNENIPENVDRPAFFDKIMTDSLNLALKSLESYNIVDPQIIMWASCQEKKLSGHIIFPNVVFEDIYQMGFFMTDIESKIKSWLFEKQIVDLKIYRKGCFRAPWNSKMSTGVNLIFYKAINYAYTNDKQLFMDSLVTNIPENHHLVNVVMPKDIKIRVKQLPKKNTRLIDANQNDYVVVPI